MIDRRYNTLLSGNSIEELLPTHGDDRLGVVHYRGPVRIVDPFKDCVKPASRPSAWPYSPYQKPSYPTDIYGDFADNMHDHLGAVIRNLGVI